MTHRNRVPLRWACCLGLAALALSLASPVRADDRTIDMKVVELKAPEKWVKKQPKNTIISYEYASPRAEGDAADGRLTVMAAGGSIEANIDRWMGQFVQPDGKNTKDVAKTEKKVIGGLDVHIVDISGTFKDSPGPFAPSVDREKYRMLAAIVVTKEAQIFLKFYGPQRTVAAEEEAFEEMIDSLRTK